MKGEAKASPFFRVQDAVKRRAKGRDGILVAKRRNPNRGVAEY